MNAAEQIAALGVAADVLTPVALIGVGYFIDRRLRDFERYQEQKRYLSETRFNLYKDIGFKLNDLFSYFMYVGLWKELTCDDVIRRKRELDRHMYTYKPLFSDALFESYTAFMDATFETFQGMGEDAKLKTSCRYRKERDLPEKQGCFTGKENQAGITTAYNKLMVCLAADLDLSASTKDT